MKERGIVYLRQAAPFRGALLVVRRGASGLGFAFVVHLGRRGDVADIKFGWRGTDVEKGLEQSCPRGVGARTSEGSW